MRLLIVLSLGAGCYQEDLPEIDIRGRVVVPEEALTREVPTFDADGVANGSTTLTDPRLLGPIYLGAYSGMDTISFDYPHPFMGPIITSDRPGDAYPFGGTTTGRLDFACYQVTSCRVVTGRFTSYADILDYFKNVLGTPVVDEHGAEVLSSDVFQQACYDYFYATSDQEMTFLGPEQFTDQGDGTWAADFYMGHTLFQPGMALWGFSDAPSIEPFIAGSAYSSGRNGEFSTCREDGGVQHVEYDQDFYEGSAWYDILNVPSLYLSADDWVADGLTVMNAEDETPTITLSVKVEE